MKEWLEHGYVEMVKRLEKEPLYQELLTECEQAQIVYDKIMEKLTPEERRSVEDYIALCEELDYQKVYTAYYCGRSERVPYTDIQ